MWKRRRYEKKIEQRLSSLIHDRINGAGLDPDSDPVVIQETLNRIAAEINEALTDLAPPFALTYTPTNTITIDIKT